MKTETIEAEVIEEVKAPVLVNFQSPVPVVDINKLLEEYSEIPEIDPESEEAKEQYQYVKKGHIALAKARNAIEKKRKEIGDPAFQFHKAVIAAAKEVQAQIHPTELLLKAQRDKVENYEEEKRVQAELAEEARKDAHKKSIANIKNAPLNHFNSNSETIRAVIESFYVPAEEEFYEFYDEAIEAYKTSMMQLEAAYETKVKAEQSDKIEADNRARLEAEETERKEKERKERKEFEAEKEAFRKAQQEAEDKLKEQQEAINLQNAEREAEELTRQQEIDRVNRENKEAHDRAETAEAQKALQAEMETEAFEDIEGKDADAILTAIIAGEVRHVFWGCGDE